jgi:predicted nucleic acid-binding Zn ribbon protein
VTDERHGSDGDLLGVRISVALSSLDDLRRRLESPGASAADAQEFSAVLAKVWREQEPLLKEVGRTVLEALRIQALNQAYEWREQLHEALADHRKPESPPE